MGTKNTIEKNFAYSKISQVFNPPWMHEKNNKNWVVHQKNIANAKKKRIISQHFNPKLLKASAIGLRYIAYSHSKNNEKITDMLKKRGKSFAYFIILNSYWILCTLTKFNVFIPQVGVIILMGISYVSQPYCRCL